MMNSSQSYFLLILAIFCCGGISNAQNNRNSTDSLEKVVKSMPADSLKVLQLFKLSKQLAPNEPYKSHLYAQQALDISERLSYTAGKSLALVSFGNVKRLHGQYDSAFQYFNDGLAMAEKAAYPAGKVNALNGIGVIYFRRGNFDKALDFFLQSLRTGEVINDKQNNTSVLNNIALVYTRQENYPKAIEFFERSLKLKHELGDKKGLASTLNNLALAYQQRKDTARALELHKESLRIKEELNDLSGMAFSLGNLGGIYTNQGNYTLADQMLYKSLLLRQEVNDKQGIATSLAGIGFLRRKQGDKKQTLEYYRQGLEIYEQLEAREEIKQVTQILAELYAELNDFKTSARYYSRSLSLADSIYRESNAEHIAEMQAKYESDQKEKDILQLNQQNELQRVQHEQNITLRNSLLGGMTLLGGLLVVAFVAYRQKRKTNYEISQKNKLLENQKFELQYQKEQIQQQRDDISAKNSHITDSIRYAQTIQHAILPVNQKMAEAFSDFFVFYRPKDVVSGDFYWFDRSDYKTWMAAIDCTGHGVPGAFMSLIGNTILSKIVAADPELTPAQVLEKLHTEVRTALRQDSSSNDDGMDICLVCIEKQHENAFTVSFAGAKRPLYRVDASGKMIEIKGDTKSIGGRQRDEKRPFSNQVLTALPNECFYLTTDGFTDQNNADKEKFGSPRFRQLLEQSASLTMSQQHELLLCELDLFQGQTPQRDDITVVGIRL